MFSWGGRAKTLRVGEKTKATEPIKGRKPAIQNSERFEEGQGGLAHAEGGCGLKGWGSSFSPAQVAGVHLTHPWVRVYKLLLLSFCHSS